MDESVKKTSKLEAAKDFWDRKKGAIAITATATTIGLVALMRKQNKTVEEFLKEHNLQEEFWKYIGATEEEIQDFIKNPL